MNMKKITAIFLAVLTLLALGVFSVDAGAEDALTVEKVEITDISTFTVYFNKEVNPINDEGTDSAWAAWYLADAEGVVDESVRNGLDFGGVSEDKKSITYIATGVDLTEKAAEAEAAGKQIAFAFDVIGGGAPPVRTVDGTETLAGNTTLTSYGSAYVVTDIEVVYELNIDPSEEPSSDATSSSESSSAGDNTPNNGGGSLSFVETALPQVIMPDWVMPVIYGLAGVCVILLAVIIILAVKIGKLKK